MTGLKSKLRTIASDVTNAAARQLSRISPYRPMSGGKAHLDEQYAGGTWEYLRGIGELSRFSVVAGYCHFLKPGGSIAEVGAGDGILHDRLDHTKVGSYLGIDISEEAIARMAPRQDERNSFVAADATRFEPPATYDLIVFNEVLEYFDDPLAVVRHWSRFLAKDGAIIVSMFSGLTTARSDKIWRALETEYRQEASTQVQNEARYRWVIKVLKPIATS